MEEKKETGVSILNNRYVWMIGAVVLLLAGWFGLRALLSSFESYRVTLVDAPKEVMTGNVATFTWRIDGPPTTIKHTSVRFGTVSNPGELDTSVKPENTQYADFVKDFADGKYDIPLQFVGNQKIDQVGKYYFRIYAQAKDKNYWSDEYTFDVIPADWKITFQNYPEAAEVGKNVTFTWRVEGPSRILNSIAVYYGKTSTPGTLGPTVKVEDTKYTDFTKDFISGNYGIPLVFVGNAKIESAGTYYFRVHTAIDGKDYWSDEFSFVAKPAGQQVQVTQVPATQ